MGYLIWFPCNTVTSTYSGARSELIAWNLYWKCFCRHFYHGTCWNYLPSPQGMSEQKKYPVYRILIKPCGRRKSSKQYIQIKLDDTKADAAYYLPAPRFSLQILSTAFSASWLSYPASQVAPLDPAEINIILIKNTLLNNIAGFAYNLPSQG